MSKLIASSTSTLLQLLVACHNGGGTSGHVCNAVENTFVAVGNGTCWSFSHAAFMP
eukprot:m.179448 g.179448  ORF g.179448 m.179448 type:complete len:56 (-) comp15477_c0_seq3:1133-1300(-)